MVKALLIGDTHFPYVNQEHKKEVIREARRSKPRIISQMGDIFDLYSFGKYARTLNLVTPLEELREARAQAVDFWKQLKKASPDARCIQILGNHDDRIMKLVQSKAPELEAVLDLLDFKKLWRFDGVQTQSSYSSEVILKGLDRGADVVLMHGYLTGWAEHAKRNVCSTVTGHSHKASLVPYQLKDRTIWELNAGYIADQTSKPMGYGAQKQYHGSVPGYGIIDSLGPRVVYLN